MAQNYYDILGITHTATPEEIKKAFRVKAKLLHPDVNPSAGAAEKFRQLNEAYEVLSDTNKRYLFDLKANAAKRQAAAGRQRATRAHTYRAASSAEPASDFKFHYDWSSISRSAASRTPDDEPLIANSLIRHMLFIMSVFVGIMIVCITGWALWNSYWPMLCGLASLPGIFMAVEGWKGLTDQKTWFASLFRRR